MRPARRARAYAPAAPPARRHEAAQRRRGADRRGAAVDDRCRRPRGAAWAS